MAGQHGGYRAPADPAPVSGPGALARRTDGGPGDKQPIRAASGGGYGDRASMESLQGAAPMEQSPGIPTAPLLSGKTPLPFDAPDDAPDEPVTTGIDAGPGAGSEVLALSEQRKLRQQEDLARAKRYLPLIEPHANLPSTPDEVRLLVRFLKNA